MAQAVGILVQNSPSANPIGGNPKLCELCKCGCGEPAPIATQTNARRGHVKGQPHRFIRGHYRRHGMSGTPEYLAYTNAKRRCNSPKDRVYKDYGGRGIRILFKSFEEFFQELGLRPTPQHSVDRFPNIDGNYEKGNVRRGTKAEQARNQRKRKGTSSIYRGVRWHKERKKYRTEIVVLGKRISLGSFPKEKEREAAEAVDAAAIKYFGSAALTNFPQKPGPIKATRLKEARYASH